MYFDEIFCRSILGESISNKILTQIKNLGTEEQKRRSKLSSEFVECPRCRGSHNKLENNDGLCEKCERIVHIIEWDKKYNEY